MTPKAKAIELYNKYMQMPFPTHTDRAKQCALIAVDEIMNALPPFTYGLEFVAKIDYWQEVKQEIENL